MASGINIFLLAPIFSAAISVALAAHASDPLPYFTQITKEDGLSHRKVNCILQDKRGFMWFGTEDGLDRYDGRYFVHFKHRSGDTIGVSGNIITDIFEDEGGLLWIATKDGGLSAYNYRLPEKEQFKQYRHNSKNIHSIPENSISAIEEDNYGFLWLGTAGSFAIRMNKSSGEFDSPIKSGTRSVYALTMTEKDTLYVGRAGGGLLKINTRTLKYAADPRYSDLYAKLPHASIPAILKDKHNTIWLASWDNVAYRLADGAERTVITSSARGLAGHDIVAFAEDGSGRIWMARKNAGISVHSYTGDLLFEIRHQEYMDGTLADDQVNKVYVDHHHVVWIATDNGISVFNPLFMNFIKVPFPDMKTDIFIYDFYKEKTSPLLIGTSEGIFEQSDNGSPKLIKLEYQDVKLAVTKFFRDVDGQFYIGTDYTLFTYDITTHAIAALPNNELDPVMRRLIGSRIVSIVRDTIANRPVLMVSPYGHYIAYYDLVLRRWVSRADSNGALISRYDLKDNLFRRFYKDQSGRLWLGTVKSGIGKWPATNGLVEYFTNEPGNDRSLGANEVFDMKEDNAGKLWVSTYGGGVSVLEPHTGKFTHLPESSNLTEGMSFDEQGKLWMICNGHIHKYDSSSGIYSCYELPQLNQTKGLSGYIGTDGDGNLYAAGVNYYVRFKPEGIGLINPAPSIYLVDFRVMGLPRPELLSRKTVELDFSENLFSIDFSAPDYTGSNLRYAYIMEGLDKNWVDAGKINTVQYNNLKPGHYRFKVRATNWLGTYTNSYAEIEVIIKPPFTRTPWFWVMLSTVLIMLAYAGYRSRVRMLLRQQAIRNGIAQDLHDQVGSTLSSISVYSEVAKRYAGQQDIPSLNAVLETIHNTAHDTVGEMSDIVWAVNPKNDHLGSIFRRINHFARPLANARGMEYQFSESPGLSDLQIGMQHRKDIFLILKESINNAIKHSGGSGLFLTAVHEPQGHVRLTIRDNGKGFDYEDSVNSHEQSGNGLRNILARAKMLNGSLTCVSMIGSGTAVTLIFTPEARI